MQPEGVVTFDWSAQEQAYVLSSYFWGYAVTSFFSGFAAELYGPRKVVFFTMLTTAVLTILSPEAAKLSYSLLVTIRVIIGLASVIINQWYSILLLISFFLQKFLM